MTDLDTKRELVSALRRDVEFLRSHGLMDYSLLLAIEKVATSANGKKGRKRSAMQVKTTEENNNQLINYR